MSTGTRSWPAASVPPHLLCAFPCACRALYPCQPRQAGIMGGRLPTPGGQERRRWEVDRSCYVTGGPVKVDRLGYNFQAGSQFRERCATDFLGICRWTPAQYWLAFVCRPHGTPAARGHWNCRAQPMDSRLCAHHAREFPFLLEPIARTLGRRRQGWGCAAFGRQNFGPRQGLSLPKGGCWIFRSPVFRLCRQKNEHGSSLGLSKTFFL